MIEKDISVTSDGNTLSGTLSAPDGDGPFPTVLMVHGSGPLDRNENYKSQKLNVFNVIADALAGAGIASVRYDKRGCGDSAGDYYSAGHVDLVDDAVCWTSELLEKSFCNPKNLFVLGHSEGAAIAPQAYLNNPAIAGLVLLCPFVDSMDSVLLRQAQQVEKELFKGTGIGASIRRRILGWLGVGVSNQQELIRKIKQSKTDTIRLRLRKVPARWFRELFQLELEPIFRRVECPVLILGGEKDLQCDPKDVQKIANLCPGPVDAHVIADLTHVLRSDPNEPAITRTRMLLVNPIEPFVVATITNWVLARSQSVVTG